MCFPCNKYASLGIYTLRINIASAHIIWVRMAKGIADIGYMIAMLVGFIVVLGVGWIVLTKVGSAFTSVGANQAAQATGYGKSALTNLGNAMTFVLFMFGLASIVLAYYVRSSPIYFPVALTIGAVFILLGALFANFSHDFIQQVDAVTGDFSIAFSSLVWLAVNQPLWIAILIFAILTLTYIGKKAVEAADL